MLEFSDCLIRIVNEFLHGKKIFENLLYYLGKLFMQLNKNII